MGGFFFVPRTHMEDLVAAVAPEPSSSTPVVEGEQQETSTPQAEQTTPADSGAQNQTDAKPAADPVQKRINQLTWKVHEAERRANAAIMAQQEAQRQARELQQHWQELQRRATMPTLEQFGHDPEQWRRAVEARNQQDLEQTRRDIRQEFTAQREAEAAEQRERTTNARIAEAMEKYPDYAEVVGNPQLPPLRSVNPPLFQALVEHEQMPELTYYLGKNTAEAHRIALLPPPRALLELGKIAARIAAAPPKQTSTAPAPPATVGSRSTADTGLSDRDDMDTWMRKRNAQLAKKR